MNTKDYLKKFDAKAQRGIFLGYSERSKAYRVYNSETHCVEESMHVKFDDREPGSKTPEQSESNAGTTDSEDAPESDQPSDSEKHSEVESRPEAEITPEAESNSEAETSPVEQNENASEITLSRLFNLNSNTNLHILRS